MKILSVENVSEIVKKHGVENYLKGFDGKT